MGLDFQITDSILEFDNTSMAKINYSNQHIGNCINIYADSILNDSSIHENFGEIGKWKGLKTIFKNNNHELPFDILGAVFYCISRMEEYGKCFLDSHGRFLHTNSVLHKLNVLQTPIVDQWLEEFKLLLTSYYPILEIKNESFKIINTFDIDQAFCYSGKGLKRNIGGLLRDLVQFKIEQVINRILVLMGAKDDPYDTFDKILSIQKKHNPSTLVFLLLAENSNFDKNINPSNPKFLEVIQKLKKNVELGIHPSYYSKEKTMFLKQEINLLKGIQKKEVYNSRQHYLRFTIPNTYRSLIEVGIRHEYSLGYAETIGFRAGTSFPFQWFDLERNEVTALQIHPFCIMDVSLKNYLNLSSQEAIKTIQTMLDEIQKVNGHFISIWHNESLSNYLDWKGWSEVYESIFELKTV